MNETYTARWMWTLVYRCFKNIKGVEHLITDVFVWCVYFFFFRLLWAKMDNMKYVIDTVNYFYGLQSQSFYSRSTLQMTEYKGVYRGLNIFT